MSFPRFPRRFLSHWILVLLITFSNGINSQGNDEGGQKTSDQNSLNSELVEKISPAAAYKSLASFIEKGDADGALAPVLALLVEIHAGHQQKITPEAQIKKIALGTEPPHPLSANIENTLLKAWGFTQEFGLLTEHNLKLMKQGKSPIIQKGAGTGLEVALNVKKDPVPNSTFPYLFEMVDALHITDTTIDPQDLTLPTPQSENPHPVRSSPASEPAPIVEFRDMELDKPLYLDDFGGTFQAFYLNKVTRGTGVYYASVNRDNLRVFKGNENYRDADGRRSSTIKKVADTQSSFAAFDPKPIPGTSEKGILLLTTSGVTIYYVDTLAPQNKHRVAIQYTPSPAFGPGKSRKLPRAKIVNEEE